MFFTVTTVWIVGVVLIAIDRISTYIAFGLEANTSLSALGLAGNLVLWLALISHLVVSIVGLSVARMRVFNPRIAIPFIRPVK